MSAARKQSAPPEERETKDYYTIDDSGSMKAERLIDAARGLGELCYNEIDMLSTERREMYLTRRYAGALFELLADAIEDILGPDKVGHVRLDPSQIRRTQH